MTRREGPWRVRARAPVRIDFAGGWSDVPAFAAIEGGVVANAAIARYVHVECVAGGGSIRLHAEDLEQRLVVRSAAGLTYDGRLDLHKAALNMLPVTGGIEVLTRADVPPGSGLGASGALDVALVAALAALRGERYSRTELAELGFQLEAGELKLAGGRQDQYAGALGGWHDLEFSADGVAVRAIEPGPERAAELEAMLVIAFTGESHFSAQTHGRVWAAYQAGRPEVVDALRAIRDLGAAAARALSAGEWRSLAALVDENWRHQQRLDATISTPAVQRVEEAARAAGAWGLKATGAGAGGCLLILAPPEDRPAVQEAVERAGARVLAATFDFGGVRVRRDYAPGNRR
jgi:D-glycero-alpha-D-manno-heptose-7-phosphate kinase